MSSSIDIREYYKLLELSFDIERVRELTPLKALFFHFHRSSFKNNSVKPFAIVLTDTNGSKQTLLLNDIMDSMKYIPTYHLDKLPSSDYAYVDINDNIKIVSNSNSMIKTLSQYYAKSSEYESVMGTNVIADEILDSVRTNLKLCKYEFTEDSSYIHITNTDLHIMKRENPVPIVSNMINPQIVTDFEDYICIGSFNRYEGKNTHKRNDINLAILDTCIDCGNPMIINYELGSKCSKCGKMNTF